MSEDTGVIEAEIVAQEVVAQNEVQALPQAAPTENEFLQVIERIALEPNADVQKMQAIIDMKMQVMEKQAEIEFNKAMSALKKEMTAVVKNRENNQTNSKYADLAAIKKMIDPLLGKHGFHDRYEDEYPETGVIRTTCHIVHESGHSKKNTVQFTRDDVGIKGSKNKTAIHGDASAMTYGQRISLCRALGVRISEDDDANAAGLLPIDAAEVAEIEAYIKKTNADQDKFCKSFGITSINEINKDSYPSALKLLKDREQKILEKQLNQKTEEPENASS